jgi:hypothetical protein
MAKSRTRKNNDNISNSGFQWSLNLMLGVQEASRQHRSNWQEVDLIREYLNRHAEEKIRLATRQIPITQKSATKILSGIVKRAKLENGRHEKTGAPQ